MERQSQQKLINSRLRLGWLDLTRECPAQADTPDSVSCTVTVDCFLQRSYCNIHWNGKMSRNGTFPDACLQTCIHTSRFFELRQLDGLKFGDLKHVIFTNVTILLVPSIHLEIISGSRIVIPGLLRLQQGNILLVTLIFPVHSANSSGNFWYFRLREIRIISLWNPCTDKVRLGGGPSDEHIKSPMLFGWIWLSISYNLQPKSISE